MLLSRQKNKLKHGVGSSEAPIIHTHLTSKEQINYSFFVSKFSEKDFLIKRKVLQSVLCVADLITVCDFAALATPTLGLHDMCEYLCLFALLIMIPVLGIPTLMVVVVGHTVIL